MAQREVGERLAASAGSGAYGVPSVLAQLACRVEVLRGIPRTVFHPVPNVDSVLVRMRRRAGAGAGAGAPGAGPAAGSRAGETTAEAATAVTPALRALVAGAFAHRRKTLPGSLALAGGAPGRSRGQVREALERLGHPVDVRAERLTPEDFRGLAELLGL
jgi:16S rRNA (adenine1518-N6/adenine1519-N6)-dimethyltransferase